MGRVFVTSDWHFCHNRDFLYQPRGYNNVYEMNKELVSKYNTVVSSEDDVYCLGDCMLNDNEEGLYLIKQLKGNIHIIRGNHDTDTRMELYKDCWNVVEVCEGKFLNYKGYHFYLSHYPTLTSNYDMQKPLKARAISLCGHTHTQDRFLDMDKGLIYHCEVDAHQGVPANLDNIILDIKAYLNK